MKIQRFLIFVQDTLLNYPDISISTIRKIIKKFENCLSNTEAKNKTTSLLLRVINEIGIKQVSLESSINKINYNELQLEYDKMKEGK